MGSYRIWAMIELYDALSMIVLRVYEDTTKPRMITIRIRIMITQW